MKNFDYINIHVLPQGRTIGISSEGVKDGCSHYPYDLNMRRWVTDKTTIMEFSILAAQNLAKNYLLAQDTKHVDIYVEGELKFTLDPSFVQAA